MAHQHPIDSFEHSRHSEQSLQSEHKSDHGKRLDEGQSSSPHKTVEAWTWENRTGPRGNLREAVAVFDTEEELQDAVDDLTSHGFSVSAISRPPSPEEIALYAAQKSLPDIDPRFIEDKKILYQKSAEIDLDVRALEDDPNIERTAYIDPDSRQSAIMVMVVVPVYILLLCGIGFGVSAGLTMMETFGFAMGLGAVGAVLGGLLSINMAKRNRMRVEAERAMGGHLLWVRTGSKQQEETALETLKRHKGRDVHMHGPEIKQKTAKKAVVH